MKERTNTNTGPAPAWDDVDLAEPELDELTAMGLCWHGPEVGCDLCWSPEERRWIDAVRERIERERFGR